MHITTVLNVNCFRFFTTNLWKSPIIIIRRMLFSSPWYVQGQKNYPSFQIQFFASKTPVCHTAGREAPPSPFLPPFPPLTQALAPFQPEKIVIFHHVCFYVRNGSLMFSFGVLMFSFIVLATTNFLSFQCSSFQLSLRFSSPAQLQTHSSSTRRLHHLQPQYRAVNLPPGSLISPGSFFSPH